MSITQKGLLTPFHLGFLQFLGQKSQNAIFFYKFSKSIKISTILANQWPRIVMYIKEPYFL